MSLLSSWAKRTRETLLASGARLSHSQVLEVLAAGLGHRSYASFKTTDEPRLASAHLAVVSVDAMVRRGADLKVQLTRGVCEVAVRALRFSREWPVQHVQVLEYFDWIVRSTLSGEGHPAKSQIANEYGWALHGISVHEVSGPDKALSDAADAWRWNGAGDLELCSDVADWAVPYQAEVSFEKLGRHLLGQARISGFERSGAPRETEFDDVVEGYLSDSDS